MIYLVHGQHEVDSRRYLLRLKRNYQNLEVLSGKRLDQLNLQRKLTKQNRHLFGGKEAVLIEGFDGDWSILSKKEPKEIDIILWSEKKIDLGEVKVKSILFDRQKKLTIFKFVDAVLYKNEKEAFLILEYLLKNREPSEKIIGSLSRSFRLLYCAKEGLIEKTKIPQFAIQKIKEQEKNWSRSDIKKALIKLLHADLLIKEGQSSKVSLATFISGVI